MKPETTPCRIRLRFILLLCLAAAATATTGCSGGGGGDAPAGLPAWIEMDPASPGGTVRAQLMISDPTAIAGLDLDLTFDANLVLATSVTKTAVTNDFVMLYNDQPAGSLAVSMARAAGLTGGAGSQALLELELEVDPSAQPGTSIPLSAALNIYDDQPSTIPVHVEARAISVQ